MGLPRTGLFPTDASDFEFAKLTLSESDDAKMIWWLFMAYFHRYEMLPVGTRSEVVLATLLLANHFRYHGWGGPKFNQQWSLHRRQCTEIAYARICDIDKLAPPNTLEHHPDSHEWGDAEAAARYTHLMSYLTPMLHKLSDEASFRARRVAFQHNHSDHAQHDNVQRDNVYPRGTPDDESKQLLHSFTKSASTGSIAPKRVNSFKSLFSFRRTSLT
jgi:hypothetical protein